MNLTQEYCPATGDAYPGETITGLPCNALSVFWIANIENYLHDNAAVGGFNGIWLFTHTRYREYAFHAIPEDPVTGLSRVSIFDYII